MPGEKDQGNGNATGAAETDETSAKTDLGGDGDEQKETDQDAVTTDLGGEGDDNGADDTNVDKEDAPENYEPFTIPDGVELSQDGLEEFNVLAKANNLSQTAAQQFIDVASKSMQGSKEAMDSNVQSMADEFKKDAMADEKIGGPKYKESISLANKAIDKFGGPGLRDMLNETGVGARKEMITILAEVGKLVKEDPINDGAAGDTGGEKKSEPTFQEALGLGGKKA